jgi:hypothetical protein
VVFGVARNWVEDDACNRLDRVNERLRYEDGHVVGHHTRVPIPYEEVLRQPSVVGNCIAACADWSTLEEILRILRSGQKLHESRSSVVERSIWHPSRLP